VDPTNRNTALASAFVEELARCGVERAVLSPGSRSTPLALALWREPEIEVNVIVDERSAGFFALGAAQASGRPVAVLTTSGTAAANLHPAVCEADLSAAPLIVLTADRPPELRDVGAGQTIDQLNLYASAVRWFCEVGTHEADDAGLLHLRQTACRAYAEAAGNPRPGPVHLNLSWRDPLGPDPVDGDVTATNPLALEGRDVRPLTAHASPPVPVSPVLPDMLAEHVAGNRRGVIVCGRQPDPSLAEPIAALAQAAGYPILAEPTSQLRRGPHDRSRVVSAYDAIARVAPPDLRPELVLRFGEMPTSKALRQWLAALPDCPQLVVDGGHGWNEPTRQAAAMVRANPVALATALAEAVDVSPADGWVEQWQAAGGAVEDALAGELGQVEGLSEPAVHTALGGFYADGDLVYTASSMPIRDQETFLRPGAAAVRFLANRGANGIDGLVSSGIGAAAARGAPAWILTGDLGLHHDSNALAALRHADTPVRIVVLNNDGGGIFEHLPQADQLDRDEFEAILGTPLGYDIAALAAAYGVPHRRIGALGELAGAAEETGLIEVPIDRRANVEMRKRLTDAAVAAVGQALALS
jgi:2-succinyl-5-enolpyruvyl-6-hydroxy-3-cyclohexene-1-carboxylate synthase